MKWLLLAPAYALGTFPSAVWIARSKGVDITSVGSGNPGASNISRTFGRRWGVLVFVLDGLKGAVPGIVGLLVADHALAWSMVAAAVTGHMFPITRRFRGGKGVATMAGAAIAVEPLVAFVMFVLWFVVLKVSNKSSLASIAIIVGFPVGLAIAGSPTVEILIVIGMNLVLMVRHWPNIKRLVRGNELSASRST